MYDIWYEDTLETEQRGQVYPRHVLVHTEEERDAAVAEVRDSAIQELIRVDEV